jgi:peptidoglycan/xylan/chitin deacetylase (PgdA/CDA1 family)
MAGFHSVTMEQYAQYHRTGSTAGLPSNPVLLTFDDGRLDSFRGADELLRQHGYHAVMFVVTSWPDAHPDWTLHWSELRRMQATGRWDVQQHAGAGHRLITVDGSGKQGEFYAYRAWRGTALESFAEYRRRVTQDVERGQQELRKHLPDYQPLGFAIPYSNYGQRFTNDRRIPDFFLSFLHTQVPVVFDGDYLDQGRRRPEEIKGRYTPRLSYRITQGPVMTLPDLYCRLRGFVRNAPHWKEYRCLRAANGLARTGDPFQ